MKSFENLQSGETDTTQPFEDVDVVKEIQEEVVSFMKQVHNPEDVYDIKSEYERLRNLILNTKYNLQDQFNNGHPSIQELTSLSQELYLWINKLFSGFAEEELTRQYNPIPESTLEQVKECSNYQGNMSMLLFDRVQSPDISSQLKKLLLLDRKYDLLNEEIFDMEKVSSEFDEDFKIISNDTPVTFKGEMSSANSIRGIRENIDPFFCDPITDKEPTVLETSYVEAHEKGHYLRRLKSTAISNYFAKTVDLSKLSITQEYFEKIKIYSIKEYGKEAEDMTHADVVELITSYFKYSVEIMERMSQLKNYFGFKGGEIFTKQHLQYAREHYVEDTQMDNYMGFLFDCITPETEECFLQVINNSGV